MSIREKIIALLNGVPEYKMGYILAYVQGLTADEDADGAFCIHHKPPIVHSINNAVWSYPKPE